MGWYFFQEFYLSALGNRNSVVFNAEKKPVGDSLSSSFFAVSSADANQDIFPLLVWQKMVVWEVCWPGLWEKEVGSSKEDY